MKMRNVRPEISIVIPCYNEAGNITALCGQLAGTLGAAGVSYECVMVDDGSTDDTLHVMKELCAASPNLNYLSFSRNFGHQKALLAGIRAAAGNAVISMDADLQHPVRLVPQLIALWREGYEVVNTARTDNAQTGLFKRATSALFYKLLAFLTGMDLRRGAADFRLIYVKDYDWQGREVKGKQQGCEVTNAAGETLYSWGVLSGLDETRTERYTEHGTAVTWKKGGHHWLPGDNCMPTCENPNMCD